MGCVSANEQVRSNTPRDSNKRPSIDSQCVRDSWMGSSTATSLRWSEEGFESQEPRATQEESVGKPA